MATWKVGRLSHGLRGEAAYYPIHAANGQLVGKAYVAASVGSQDHPARLMAAAPLLEQELQHALAMMVLRCGDDQATIDRFRAALAHCSLAT